MLVGGWGCAKKTARQDIYNQPANNGNAGSQTVQPDQKTSTVGKILPNTTEVKTYNNLVYARAGNEELKLDLYAPADVSQKWPVIVWIHGGGWIEGTKTSCIPEQFVGRGYVVACVDYRLASQGGAGGCKQDHLFPAQIHDVKAAVRWLRKNASQYNIDANNFSAVGDSSGGHLASLLGVTNGVASLQGAENLGYSDAVQAVADWFGPVDVRKEPPKLVFTDNPCEKSLDYLNQKYGGEATPYFYWTRAWGLFLGGSLTDPAIVKKAGEASPLSYLDKNDPPFLVMHGENDGMVPVNQSEMFVRELKQAGIDVTFVKSPFFGHGFGAPGGKLDNNFFKPTVDFFDKYLKK